MISQDLIESIRDAASMCAYQRWSRGRDEANIETPDGLFDILEAYDRYDADFISLLDPETVVGILDEIERLRSEYFRVSQELAWLAAPLAWTWDGTLQGAVNHARGLIDKQAAEIIRLNQQIAVLESTYPCDGGCEQEGSPLPECSRHGYSPRDLWEAIELFIEELNAYY